MLNDEKVNAQLDRIETRLDQLEQCQRDSADLMNRILLDLDTLFRKTHSLADQPIRRNCSNCGRLVQTASRICPICGKST